MIQEALSALTMFCFDLFGKIAATLSDLSVLDGDQGDVIGLTGSF